MSDLPEGWVAKKLADTCAEEAPIIYGILQPLDNLPTGVPYVRPTEILDDGKIDRNSIRRTHPDIAQKYKRSTLRKGDIILSIVGTIGKVARVPEWLDGGNITQSSCRIRPNTLLASVDWVEYFLASPLAVGQYDGSRLGTAVPRLNLADVRNFEIPLPPLAEQGRIVEKLDALSAQSAAANTALTRIETLITRCKSAVLGAVYDRIDASTIAIGDITKRVTKGASPKWQGFQYQDDGILFIRSQNVLWGSTDISSRAYLDKSFNDKQPNSVIEEGDVLLNIVGASIGRSAIATKTMVGANCNQAVAVIKLNNPSASSKYVMNWLLSPKAQKAIHDGSVDVARANFSLGGIKSLQLPWPPLEEQAEIVARIEAAFAQIETLARATAAARARLTQLDRALLTRAFKGKLVPQNPKDEPASELLKRVKEQKV